MRRWSTYGCSPGWGRVTDLTRPGNVTLPASPQPPVAICYLRISPRGRPDTGLGMAAQRDRCERLTADRLYGWQLEWVEERVTGRLPARQRPGLAQALRRLDSGNAQGLVVARLDRLTRRVADLLDIVDRAHSGGWRLVVPDLDLDTQTPFGMAIVTILGAISQLERDLIAQRTREALAEARRRGVVLGPPTAHSDATLRNIRSLRDRGDSLQAIADYLNHAQIPTALGAKWRRTTVARALRTEERHRLADTLRDEYQGNLFAD